MSYTSTLGMLQKDKITFVLDLGPHRVPRTICKDNNKAVAMTPGLKTTTGLKIENTVQN